MILPKSFRSGNAATPALNQIKQSADLFADEVSLFADEVSLFVAVLQCCDHLKLVS